MVFQTRLRRERIWKRIFTNEKGTMKLIISKTALEMAVKNICRVINTKNALPILGDVLCILDV